MCLIIDSNCADQVFSEAGAADFAPVVEFLFKRRGRIAVGGGLAAELRRSPMRAQALLQLERAHQVVQPTAGELAAARRELRQHVVSPRSNQEDHDTLALALLSGAEVLVSRDQALGDDYRDLPGRRAVYKRAEHKHLLRGLDCGTPWRPVRPA